MDNLEEKARLYATSAHARINQLRKYSLKPYDVHLRAVAGLVDSVTDDKAMIAASWLHDTVEDTPATFEDLEREFGTDVMILVKELTDVSKPGDGNRAMRKEIDRQHLSGASPRAKTIKLADIIDNCEDICRHDPKFGKVYLVEMQALLEVLKEGDQRLYDRAVKMMVDCEKKLGVVSHATENSTSLEKAAEDAKGLVQGRLEKAKKLQEERIRRGFDAELVDCLQFSDKLQIVFHEPSFVENAGFQSASAAKRAMKDLESLRNDLAHGQDITKHDWPPIVRLAQRIQHLYGG